MIPKLNETISLITLNTRHVPWIVRSKVSATVESVEFIDNQTVYITATAYGRQYHCQRSYCPVTLAELRDAVWTPAMSRQAPSDHNLFVEEVLAFNLHRELGHKSHELLYDGAIRTSLVPYAHNSYCAEHDRAHYWGECCLKCSRVLQAA